MSTQKNNSTEPSNQPLKVGLAILAALTSNPAEAPSGPTEAERMVTESSDRARAQVVASGRTEETYSELVVRRDDINSQLVYWNGVKAGATADLEAYQHRITCANRVLAEIPATSKRSQDRSDRDSAVATLEHFGWRLTQAQKRLTNATAQIKTWTEREANFPKERFAQLKAEEERRRHLVGTTSHVTNKFASNQG